MRCAGGPDFIRFGGSPRRYRRGLAALLAFSCGAFAATTQTWEMNGYADFLKGRMQGLALNRDGRLVVGPQMDTVFTSDQPQIWSVAQAPDGSIYAGTGNRGQLYRVDAGGKAKLVWTADQPEIFAVAVDDKGVVYAGTSPDGKVYRIENGKAAEYFAPGAKYIWALKPAADGSLYVATGDQGKIFRVTSAGHGDVYYETGQQHVTCLALDKDGRLLAGSEPNGILYRISARNKAFVLYGASLPEIRTIVPAADGSIYAAALGGSVAKRTSAIQGAGQGATPMVTAPAMSITVTDAAQAGLVQPPKPAEAPKPVAPVQPAVIAGGSSSDVSGVEKSALYKINPDNTVETLWSSKDEDAYDLVADGADLVFITDEQGRIYRLDRDRKTTLIAQTNEGDATRLIESRNGLLAATGNLAKILRLSSNPGAGGWFESPVHDAGTVARWGRLTWRGEGAMFKTRSGNSPRPDATWSEWSEPISSLERSHVTSPNARYIQWRAELSSAGAGVEDVTVAYLPQNTPPVVRSINVNTLSLPGAGKGGGSAAAYSVTVTDSSDAPMQAQTLGRAAGQQIQVSWQADDADGDKLIYSLYFRGEDEREWKLLRANMTEATYLLDGDVFADGRYYFKVTASDRPSNPAEFAKEADLVSAPVLIDNTPPVVTASAPRRAGSAVEIDVDAEDHGSVLRRCEYSIDAGPWSPVEAADGVTDSSKERFEIRLASLPAGEHLIVIRAYDAAGNAGVTKVVVR